MAWTTPKTFTAAAVLTAAELNTHLRDNLNETSAATVTTAGDMTYADAANSMGSRLAIGAAGTFLASTGSAPVWRVPTQAQGNGSSFTFTNTGFATLDAVTGGTAGAAIAVTVTTGAGTAAVFWRARMSNDTGGASTVLGYSISGATTTAATDITAISYESSSANDTIAMGSQDLASVNAGSNVFELEARVTSGTATMLRTELFVIPF